MKQLSTRTCETVYDVDGVLIRLWIIAGGIPAIDFDSWGFTKRFPIVEKWSDENYIGVENRYKHQERINLQGPTFEVLPNGEQDILDYIKENLPKRDLCLNRANELISILQGKNTKLYADGWGMKLESKGKRDKEEHTIARASWCIRPTYISPIGINSAIYGGFVEIKIELFSKWWKEAKDLINHLSWSNFYWHDITEEKYQAIKAHVEKFNPKKD
jgi:hypothetical protein